MISSVYLKSTSSTLPFEGEPDYKSKITNATQRRRMSRIIKMGLACALDCVAGQPLEEIEAVITATGLGCLEDTEKFLKTLLDNNEQLLNPTPFMQSTFNTVGAQIALTFNNHSYNMTYSHRGNSFESALLDGMLRIREGDKSVLVGAFDEITPNSVEIQNRLGIPYSKTIPGEGSQFFLLSGEKDEDINVELFTPYMFSGEVSEEEVKTQISNYIKSFDLEPEDIMMFYTPSASVSIFPEAGMFFFKNICGDYPTASAYALWHAAQMTAMAKSGKYILVYNEWNGVNHSLILLKNCR